MSASRLPLYTGAFAVLLSGSAMAATLEATSHVTAATVFSDRALITREAKIHVPAGANTVSLTDMPAGLNEASLRVTGKAGAAVKIGAVEVKRVFLTEAANTAERDKQAALEAKTDEKAILEGEIKALETRGDFIDRLIDNGADKHDAANQSKLDFTPEKWAQAWGLVQSGMAETQKDLVLKHIAIRKVDAEIAKLQAEINQVRANGTKQRRDATINIEAAQETDLQLSLTYQTSGASWHPVYDARLDTNNGSLELEQYGQVSQQTGEAWTDAELTLSTTQPAYGSEMPAIYVWAVNLLRPVMQMARREMGGAYNMAASPAALSAMKMDAADAVEAKVQEIVAAPEQAIAQTSEYAAEFQVPGHVTLKSINEPTKLFIASTKMKADLSAKTAPRLSTQAFLFAKVTNNEEYPLIPGTVAKYRDGAFIGNAALSLLRPKETADLSFGADDRIKVVYQKAHESVDNPTLVMIGDVKVSRQYQSKITNLHKEPVNITVFEQYPVSNDPDVKAEIVDNETTAGFENDPDKRQGVILWSGTYKAKEEKTFTIGWRVQYPKGKQITGL